MENPAHFRVEIYKPLPLRPAHAAFAASVEALVSATRSGDADLVRAAVGKVKVPYSKLFLKFG